MATSVHKLGHACSAAAAFGDLVAVSTPSNTVALHRRCGSALKLDRIAELEGHEATISGLHFHGGAAGADGGAENRSDNSAGSAALPAAPLRLVSASHDRNSFVWTQQAQGRHGGSGWQPEMVVTRLQKAGLFACWSPCGLKYAIGGSEQAVDVLYWAADKDLWAPKLIKKRHDCAVMAAVWHPSGALLATVSSDCKLRLLNAVVPGVDGRPGLAALGTSRFGDCLLEVPLPGGWGLAVAFSPDGATLAAASQSSQLTLLTQLDLDDPAALDAAAATGRLQHLQLPDLPLKCLAFLSDNLLAGGGFDFCPHLFSRQANGQWRHAARLHGLKSGSQASHTKASSLTARIKHFEQQAASTAATASSRAAASAVGGGALLSGGGGTASSGFAQHGSGPHHNCIISIVALPSSSPARLAFFTASLEGCLAEWHVDPAGLQGI